MSSNLLKNFKIHELTTKWQKLQETPNVFSYRLNVTESKYLDGYLNFYAELNPERSNLRRKPQTIISLDHPFDEKNFNFKKIKPQEYLMNIPYGQSSKSTDNHTDDDDDDETTVSLIINISPLTPYHSLICPNVSQGLKQRITLEALRFSVDLLLSIENNQDFRIGYNSPGALASVNHLHLHILYVNKELYIDRVKLSWLAQPHIHRLAEDMPTEALCFIIQPNDSLEIREEILQKLYQFLIWLCDQNMPHNLFITPERIKDGSHNSSVKQKNIKIFVFAREDYCVERDLSTFNIGFCELAGFVTVGSKSVFDSLTENEIVNKINRETGSVFQKIYSHFLE